MAIAAICVDQAAESNLSLSPHIPVKSNNGFSSCAQDIIKILFRFIERTAGGLKGISDSQQWRVYSQTSGKFV